MLLYYAFLLELGNWIGWYTPGVCFNDIFVFFPCFEKFLIYRRLSLFLIFKQGLLWSFLRYILSSVFIIVFFKFSLEFSIFWREACRKIPLHGWKDISEDASDVFILLFKYSSFLINVGYSWIWYFAIKILIVSISFV